MKDPQLTYPTMVKSSQFAFVGLNVIRGLSIVTLILLFVSSVMTMAQDIKSVNTFMAAEKSGSNSSSGSSNSTGIDCTIIDCDYIEGSTVPNQPAGAFWAVLNRLLIIFQAIVLALSEVGVFTGFFDVYFPILGSKFGTGALGVIQCLLGAAVLSHHVDEFSLVSAFFLFSVGCLNIFVGLIYREKAKVYRHLSKFKEESEDVLPTVAPGPRPLTIATQMTGSSKSMASLSGKGFGRQASKDAAEKGYSVQEPEPAVPPYAPKPSRANSTASSNSSSTVAPH